MSPEFSFGRMDLRTAASLEQPQGRPDPDTPFRIAVLGDFSARASRGVCEPDTLRKRRAVGVDRDNFEQVMAAMAIELCLPLGGDAGSVVLPIRELDDFHPDRIYERVELFASLRQLRRRLQNATTFEAAAAELRALRPSVEVRAPESPRPIESPPAPAASVPIEGLLDDILAETPQAPAGADASPWESLVAEIVRPYVLPKTDPQQAEYVAACDTAAAELMRAILHHREFQALEAAWRGLDFLVARLETDAQLKLHFLDVSQAELAADLAAADDLQASGTYHLLVGRDRGVPDAVPWALLAGNYTFGPGREDAEIVGRLGRIVAQAAAPLIAGADPRLLGCQSLSDTPDPDDWQQPLAPEDRRAWDALRRLPEARYLGLALPRVLMRLPYGPGTSGTERFAFDELPGVPEHRAYLWANPCFACVYLFGRAFSVGGWHLRSDLQPDIEDLPVHVYHDAGEAVMQPCAETLLVERAAEAIIAHGLMPVISFRGQGAVRLASLLSLADPPAPLRGRWT